MQKIHFHSNHPKLFAIAIAFTLLSMSVAYEITSLIDFPLKLDKGSFILQATLIDPSGSAKYEMKEWISVSGSNISGKIEVSAEKEFFNVHYPASDVDTSLNLKERLVIKEDKNCWVFTYKNKWDRTLPETPKPLTSMILLIGPSVLYRLACSSLVWTEVETKNIRGATMKGATTEVGKVLKITFYYKAHFDAQTGIKNPSRIEFSGYDSASGSEQTEENLILDIYLQSHDSSDKFKYEVKPPVGIGCLIGLPRVIPLPRLNNSLHYVHFAMTEHTQSSTQTKTFSEVYASDESYLLKLKSTSLDETTIYDFRLGVGLNMDKSGHCNETSVSYDTLGVSQQGEFSLDNIFHLNNRLQYIGKRKMPHRPGLTFDVWESVHFHHELNGKMVDKAVTNQFFAKSIGGLFSGYMLFSTTISSYKLDSSKKSYTLMDKITRDYTNFQNDGFDYQSHDVFTVKECDHLFSGRKLTLSFKLSCEDLISENDELCHQPKKAHVYQIKNNFLNSVIFSHPVSPLRIDDIQLSITESETSLDVTILDKPAFQYFSQSKTMFVSEKTFEKAIKIVAMDQQDCMQKVARSDAYFEIIIFKIQESYCGYLHTARSLKEDREHGKLCIIHSFPMHNLRRVYQELSLDELQSTFLNDIGKVFGTFHGHSTDTTYKITEIIEKILEENIVSPLYYQVRQYAKLKSEGQASVNVSDVKSFADCYRACHSSKQLSCETFSFCDGDTGVDCRVSSILTEKLELNIEQDKKCSIFGINKLDDYSLMRNRKFKNQISISVERDLTDCANACHGSVECVSFQYCGSYCSFAGLYTDSSTEYDAQCTIYTPKASKNYEKTGNKIVSEVIHTEMNLNLDQCASLCDEWFDGKVACKSFNYCPKSRSQSSCSLTAYSVESSDVETADGGQCSNYGLKGDSDKRKDSSSIKSIKQTSRLGAFGIIMLFLFTGILSGFATPFAYEQIKRFYINSKDTKEFSWTKQLDEETENAL